MSLAVLSCCLPMCIAECQRKSIMQDCDLQDCPEQRSEASRESTAAAHKFVSENKSTTICSPSPSQLSPPSQPSLLLSSPPLSSQWRRQLCVWTFWRGTSFQTTHWILLGGFTCFISIPAMYYRRFLRGVAIPSSPVPCLVHRVHHLRPSFFRFTTRASSKSFSWVVSSPLPPSVMKLSRQY